MQQRLWDAADQLRANSGLKAQEYSGPTGLLQGTPQGGAVGVLLVPDVPEVTTALRTYGVLQLELGVEAPVSTSKAGLFSSESATFRLAFPRYRVLLYNAAKKSAEATVYAYLSTL